MSYIKYILPLLLFLTGGVTTSFAQFTEDFEGSFPPPGWAVFDNGVGTTNEWLQSPIRPNTGNNHAYVRFTNITNMLAEDWLVTPKLLPQAGDNTLTFYGTDDFPADYGSIYTVRVSTLSQTDAATFEEVAFYTETDFTNDVYQQKTVDLSAYNGQEIYVAFVLENSNGDSFFLDDVSGPTAAPATAAPNCDAMLITPEMPTDVFVTTDLAWETASGDPLGYVLRIGTSPGGDEFLLPTDVGANTEYEPLTDFDYNTTYYVTILPYNGQGNASINTCTEFSFTTEPSPDIILDCTGNPNSSVNQTLCYGDLFTREFTITSNGSEQVQLSFNSGTLEDGLDLIYIYDGTDDTGNLLNAGKLSGNFGDLSNLSYVSSTGTLFVRLETDVNNSCASGTQTTLDYTASCIACNPPVGTATISNNCDSQNSQFYINLDLTDLGDGSVTVKNNQFPGTYTINNLGTTEIGPFNFGTVVLTLENSSNSACSLTLPALNLSACPLVNDDCSSVTPLVLSTDGNCNNAIMSTTTGATPSDSGGTNFCQGPDTDDDVWFSFTPASTDRYIFELSNSTAQMGMIIYNGTCAGGLNNLTDCISEGTEITLDLTENITYLVQVFTLEFGNTSDFGICVYASPPAPANDLCGSALSIGDNDTFTNQDASYATADDAVNCGGNNNISSGVWYQFMGTGENANIDVSPQNWDAEIQIWSGADCSNLSCMTFKDDGGTGSMETIEDFATVSGLSYYVYIGHFDNQGAGGLFNLSMVFEAPLVQDFVELTGQATSNGNTLQWVPNAETNFASFIIERSENGQDNWIEMEQVAANLPTHQAYTWEDKSPLDLTYYRLKMIKQNGSFRFSYVIAIEQGAEKYINVFPVPAEEQVTVQYATTKIGTDHLFLTDVTGRIVHQQVVPHVAGINKVSISLAGLASGIYSLNINNEGTPITARVVKR